MNQQQRARWEITRTRGFWRYVLLYWVLIWGGAVIVVSSMADYFLSHHGLGLAEFEFRVPAFLIAGFVAGTIVWLIGEHKYRKSSQQDGSRSDR